MEKYRLIYETQEEILLLKFSLKLLKLLFSAIFNILEGMVNQIYCLFEGFNIRMLSSYKRPHLRNKLKHYNIRGALKTDVLNSN
jgi:hypothetical protein